jgi:hypothetical protein
VVGKAKKTPQIRFQILSIGLIVEKERENRRQGDHCLGIRKHLLCVIETEAEVGEEES